MNIKIRKVNISDAKNLLPLIQKLGYTTTEESMIAKIAYYQYSFVDRAWVALDGESIVGCIAIHVHDVFHSTERFGRITTLTIKKSHRRQGIGKKLLNRAERYAALKNCEIIELANTKKNDQGLKLFYSSMGYNNYNEKVNYYYLRKYLQG